MNDFNEFDDISITEGILVMLLASTTIDETNVIPQLRAAKAKIAAHMNLHVSDILWDMPRPDHEVDAILVQSGI